MASYVLTQFGKAELKGRYGADRKPIIKDGIKLMAKAIKKHLSKDYQMVVLIDGGTGSGKSNLAVHLALCLDPNWNLELFYIYDIDDLRRAVDSISTPYPVFLFDEGSIILNAKNTLKTDDKDIIGLFDTMRYLHVTSIICCPNAMRLNKSILFDHADFRLVCPPVAPIKGYDPRGFVHIHGKWRATWTEKMSWPFIATTSFPKMSKSMHLRYDALKKESSKRVLDRILKR